MKKASKRRFRKTIRGTAMLAFILVSGLAIAEEPLPLAVQSAMTLYIVNETGNEKVLATATDQFTSWGRFTMSKSKDGADLVITFTHKMNMDKWGNLGTTEMSVAVKGHPEPVFVAHDSLKLITDPQHPTKACIQHFRNRLEGQKHH